MFWLMVFGLAGLVFIFLPWLVTYLLSRRIPVDTSRRRFLQGAAVLYPLALMGGGSYGYFWERRQQVKRTFPISMPALSEMAGYKMAQISDVHIGKFFAIADLERLLEEVAADKPDVLLITGDLFDDVHLNPEAVAVVDKAVALFPDGIYFCIGNHEYYRNWQRTHKLLQKTRVQLLVGTAQKIPGRNLWLAGAEYSFARDDDSFQQEKEDLVQKAIAKIPPEELAHTVLLAHHPEFIDNGAAAGIPLTLTGHTHGGQFGIWGMSLMPVYKYNRGMIKIGASYGYVHSGNGSWLPVRIGCPPEIAYFVIN